MRYPAVAALGNVVYVFGHLIFGMSTISGFSHLRLVYFCRSRGLRMKRTRESRIEAAWRRARLAKTALASIAIAGFGVWMAFARVTYAGHAKHAIRPLAIPQPMYDVVRRNLLQAGILAPATAPPDATTSSS